MGDSMEVDEQEYSTSSVNNSNCGINERGKKSFLWKYFTSVDPQRAQCKLCSAIVSHKTTSSNLKAHLLRKHPDIKTPGVTYNYRKAENATSSPDKKCIIFVKSLANPSPTRNTIQYVTSTPEETLKEPTQRNVVKVIPPEKLLKLPTPKDDFIFGCSDFQTMSNKTWYVDKTPFIKSVLNECDRLLITAPRRCGKTTNLNMLKKFVEIEIDRNGHPVRLNLEHGSRNLSEQQTSRNFNLFTKKKIFKVEGVLDKNFITKHFGAYPVIYTSFKNVSGGCYREFRESLHTILQRTFKQHIYLLDSRVCEEYSCEEILKKYMSDYWGYSSEDLIRDSLRFLSEALCSHFANKNKVFVIIDDLDEPINNIIHNKDMDISDTKKILHLLKSMLVNLLKDNPSIGKVLAVANHDYAKALIPDCNFIHKPYLQSDICEYFGFSNDEVEKLLAHYDLSSSLNEVKIWYNGYAMTTSSGALLEMYNNWSILQYLYERDLKNYQPLGSLNKLRKALVKDELRNKIETLISRRSLSVKYKNDMNLNDVITLKKIFASEKYTMEEDDINLLFQFLYEEGYLNLLYHTDETIELSIPNIEIFSEYFKLFSSFNFFKRLYQVTDEDLNTFYESLNNLKQGVMSETIIQFADSVKNIFRNTRILPQNDFELQAPLYHFVKRYFQGVKGEALTMPKRYLKCDIGLSIDDKLGVILEVLTFDRGTSIDALTQIVSNKYSDIFNFDGLTDELYMGLHLGEDKRITISYLVNNTDLGFTETVTSS